MARHSIQTNFTSGVLSERIFTRVDLTKYNNGLETCENWMVFPHGGVTTRPGTRFIAATQDSARKARLIPFRFNTAQTYACEFGHQIIRFFSNGGRVVENATTITNAVNNGSGLIRLTISSHGYATNDAIVVASVTGTTEANGEWVITVINANTLDLNSSSFSNTYSSGGTAKRIVQVTSPYTESDVAAIDFTQDADILTVVHENYAPRQLERLSATSFQLTTIAFVGGPFQALNTTTTTMNPSGTTGNITVTASASYFTSAMVNQFLRIGGTTGTPAKQGYVKITGYTNATTVDATVQDTLDGSSATDNWALGSWGEHSKYPRTVTRHQQRVVYGGSPTEPETLKATAVGTTKDFTVGTNDDDAYDKTVASDEANVIRWLAGQKALLIGTSGNEFSLVGENEGTITATKGIITPESNKGSKNVHPLQIDNNVVYVQRAGRKLRNISFDFAQDAYISPNLALLAEHIMRDDPIVEMSYQQEQNSVIWLVLESGKLCSLTWLRDQDVVAWATHPMTNGLVESIITLPSEGSAEDEVWIVVKRTVNSATKRYIEQLDRTLDVDCGLSGAIGSPGRTISGLDHLEGQVVRIVGDGAVYNDATVSSGSVTIQTTENAITNAKVGLPFLPKLITLEPEFELPGGTSFGRKKRWAECFVRVIDTLSLLIRPVGSSRSQLTNSRNTEDYMDSVPATPTQQDLQVTMLETGNRGRVEIQQTQSLPATVLGVFGKIEVGE